MSQEKMTKPGAPNGGKPAFRMDVLKRVVKLLFHYYRLQMIFVVIGIVLASAAASMGSIFMNRFLINIEKGLAFGWDAVKRDIVGTVLIMVAIYATGLLASFTYTRIMAVVTQSFLNKLRHELFARMQDLPIRYFDTHAHGDIMSHYTNDIDTIRELVSVTIPHIINSGLIILFLVFNMFYLSIWMALVVFVAVIAMFLVTRHIGGNSAKNFMRMQKSIGKTEGFVEEMMTGQKVVKVFCHEDYSVEDFDKVNGELCENATRAHLFANILMPIMGNIGNILYVLIAFVGGALIVSGNVSNLSLSGQAICPKQLWGGVHSTETRCRCITSISVCRKR